MDKCKRAGLLFLLSLIWISGLLLNAGICRGASDVTAITRITGLQDGDDRNPMWSPDGSKLVYDQQTALYTINADGTGKQLLMYGSDLPDGTSFTLTYYPCWSPDGQTIAFTSDANGSDLDIWLWSMGNSIEASGLNQTDEWDLKWAWGGSGWFLKVTGDSVDDWYPRWGPSGLLFVSYAENLIQAENMSQSFYDNSEIFLNTHSTRLTSNTVADLEPAWSPDGTKIAFVSQDDIWVMNADGSGVQKLTSWAGTDSSPTWSPDGSMIAYISSSRTKPWNELWVMNSDGTGAKMLIDNNVIGENGSVKTPAWSPDGTKIAFAWENYYTLDDDIFIASVDLGVSAPSVKTNYILAAQGGAVVYENVKVEIPANALSSDISVTVSKTTGQAPSGYTIVSQVYEFGPSGTSFSIPVTITIPYDEATLPSGFDESKLKIYMKSNGGWQQLESQVDTENNEVSTSVSHFSQYAVMADSGSTAGPGGTEDILGILGYIGPVPILLLVVVVIVVLGVILKAGSSKKP